MNPIYVATLRAIFEATDDAQAMLIADKIRENGSVDLNDDDDSDDDLFVTQVTSNSLDISPEETIQLFRHARNALIRLKVKECVDLARELDKWIFRLVKRVPDESNYDYGHFMDVVEDVLNGGNPIT